MAKIPSGILGTIVGPLQNLTFRNRPNRSNFAYNRKHVDRQSAEQLEIRRRLGLAANLLSKVYLRMLKPYYRYPRSFYTALDVACKYSLENWFEWEGVPWLRLYRPCGVPEVDGWYIVYNPVDGNQYAYWGYSSYQFQDGDQVQVFMIQDRHGLSCSCSDSVPWERMQVKVARAAPWPSGWLTYLCLYCIRQAGSRFLTSDWFPYQTKLGPIL